MSPAGPTGIHPMLDLNLARRRRGGSTAGTILRANRLESRIVPATVVNSAAALIQAMNNINNGTSFDTVIDVVPNTASTPYFFSTPDNNRNALPQVSTSMTIEVQGYNDNSG